MTGAVASGHGRGGEQGYTDAGCRWPSKAGAVSKVSLVNVHGGRCNTWESRRTMVDEEDSHRTGHTDKWASGRLKRGNLRDSDADGSIFLKYRPAQRCKSPSPPRQRAPKGTLVRNKLSVAARLRLNTM